MKVALAVPYRGKAADADVELDDEEAAQLIRDGWARRAATPANDPLAPPPLTGKGSGDDAWKAYATAHGLGFGENSSKLDIIASLKAAGVRVD